MNYPKLQGTERNTQVLLEDYEILGEVVPEGYETNWQDSPRWSWPFGYTPFKPKYSPAYVIHDYLLDRSDGMISSIRYANSIWCDIMWKIEPTTKTKVALWCFKMYWKTRFAFRSVL